MGSVIFVHGTGAREDSYKESLSIVAGRLMEKRADLSLVPCLWGEEFGARLNKNGASIPDFDSARAPDALSDEEYEIGLWAALYDDPLYELRVMSLQTRQPAIAAPNQLSPYQQLDSAVKNFSVAGELGEQLRKCGLVSVWEDAARAVTTSNDYKTALMNAPAASDDYRLAIARAITAEATRLLRDRKNYRDDESPVSADDRDLLIELVMKQFGGHRGPLGWIAKQVISRPVTFLVRRKRGKYSESAFPFPGDILLYQARGDDIRGRIRSKIKKAAPPVILLAHSLGGIACVDLLILESLPEVALLVTAGSQAPFFYEIGALYSLPFGESLPDYFPKRWLNIYDPRDFLSYLAEGVFPDHPDVAIKDVRVNNKEPFPQSHSAYWRNNQVWDAINDNVREVLK